MTVEAPEIAERVGFETLPRAGIHCEADALLTLPSWYLDTTTKNYGVNDCLQALETGKKATIGEFLIQNMIGFDDNNRPVHKLFTRFTRRLVMSCIDRSGHHFQICQFGAVFGWKDVPRDQFMFMTVKGAQTFRGKLQLEAAPCDGRIYQRLGTVIPMYAGIPGVVKSESMANCIDDVTTRAMQSPAIWLTGREAILAKAFCSEPDLLKASNTLASNLAVLLRGLHRPKSIEEAMLARAAITRVAAAAVQARSRHFFSARPANPDSVIPGVASRVATLVGQIEKRIAGRLTTDQLRTIRMLTHAFAQPIPSAHMINGDVGTGKTFAFMIPAVAAYLAGKKVAIMGPTGILADQLARVLVDYFPEVVVKRVETGKKMPVEHCIVVGTPGLTAVTRKAKWVPDVLVIDEQHKFPTEVREAMVGPHTHVVEATATPIPRSLAIALYTGMTQIILKDVPVQKDLRTSLYFGDGPEERAAMNAKIHAGLRAGKKVAFIYPAVERTPRPEVDPDALQVVPNPDEPPPPHPRVLANVSEAYEKLCVHFPGKVARLYGSLSDDDKAREVEAIKSGEKNVLVASSLVEVGIDIPSLDYMVVRDADYFGAAQLHQMRGRLARRGGIGEFMLHVSRTEEETDKNTVRRLRTLERTTDGFELAEIDMDERGFGDTGGDQQSGRVFMIVRGITLRPRDFLDLSMPEAPVHTLAELAEDPELEPMAETVGQMSLI